jgi:wobble nucleotide-excising tRNase
MIKTITLCGYKSFHASSPVRVELRYQQSDPIYFYGLNGAGKSAIAEAIRRHPLPDERLPHCDVEVTAGGPFRFLVYNESFVTRVLGESAGMPGIFTLGEPDTAAQAEIDDREKERIALDLERINLAGQLEGAKQKLRTQNELSLGQVWEVHTKFKDSKFRSCLKHGNDRQRFFNELHAVALEGQEPPSLDELARRLRDAEGPETAKSRLGPLPTYPLGIEPDAVWIDCIHGSNDSRLAELVHTWGNSDWVGKGREHVHGDLCPFCQQSLPENFLDDLATLLDGVRRDRIRLLESYVSRFGSYISSLTAYLASATRDAPEDARTELGERGRQLIMRAQANLALMERKVVSPAEPIELVPVEHEVTLLASAVEAANSQIDDFNRRISDRKGERRAIETAFWQVMRWDRAIAFAEFEGAMRPLNEALNKLQSRDLEVAAQLREVDRRLAQLRQKQSGVDAAVERINARLANLGVHTFKITRLGPERPLYTLERPGQGKSETRSLSEGERTLIAFLYYLELLRGAEVADVEYPIRRTIAVVDDPISSLSHNHIYDIAALIHHELVLPAQRQTGARQVLVFTHNLFFLHELLKQLNRDIAGAAKKCHLLRVVKRETSQVVPMDPKDLLNDYDALWHVLRDADADRVPSVLVPNTMRCILEHFFAFTSRQTQLKDALTALTREDASFAPLARFLDRGSHKDDVNITIMDCAAYDVPYYLAKLRAVFELAGCGQHFDERMGVPAPSAETTGETA